MQKKKSKVEELIEKEWDNMARIAVEGKSTDWWDELVSPETQNFSRKINERF